MNSRTPLPPEFFHRTAPEVARALLGAVVVSRIGRVTVAARIVETEAYLGYDDPASHAWRGRRNRQNEGIYSPPGHWYIYRSYGIHWCANLVCAPPGLGTAVLLRALEPVAGIAIIRGRRSRQNVAPDDRALMDGPGKLCQALGITRALDGRQMSTSAVRVFVGSPIDGARVRMTPRIGITRAADLPLRFLLQAESRAGIA